VPRVRLPDERGRLPALRRGYGRLTRNTPTSAGAVWSAAPAGEEKEMAQGEFTKEEADETIKAFTEVFKALSKPKQVNFFGHANDIFLFLEAAKREAPNEKTPD